MMVPTHGSSAWINQFAQPPLVQSPVAPVTSNYTSQSHHTQQPQQQQAQQQPQQQHSPQSSYPPTPPKEEIKYPENDSRAFTPTSNSAFAYTDYHTGASYKHSSSNSQNGASSPLGKQNKSRTRTGTGRPTDIMSLLVFYFLKLF